MSEFSESYHLRSERVEDAIELLRRAERKGFVYQPTNGWVTFLAEDGCFEPDGQIVASALHPLLHYVFTEDHGWSFTLYTGTKVVSAYRCDWNYDIRVSDSLYSRGALQKAIPEAQPALLEDFERLLRPQNLDELFETEPSKLFAQGVGLKHFEWLSYDYMAHDFSDSPEDHAGVTEVT